MSNQKRLSTAIIRKQFAGTFMVMTMVELANAVTALIDGLMTARLLGPTEMAADGLTQPYFTVATIISGMLMVSCQTICAKSMGSGKMDEANRTFSLTCVLALIASTAMAVLGIIFATPIAQFLGARGDSAELLPYVRQYLIGLLLGTPFNVMIPILVPILRLDGDTGLANAAAAAVAIGDVGGNVLFVVGFKLGLFGFGLGTSFSYVLGCAVLMIHFLKKDRMFRFSLKKADWGRVPGILSAGLPRAVSKVGRTLAPVIINSIILAVGATAAMTAASIQNNTRLLIFTPATGIGSAVLLMAGIFAGEQDVEGIRAMFSIALQRIFTVILAIGIGVFIAAPLIVGFYLPDGGEAARLAVAAMRWYALLVPIKPVNMVISSYLQAMGFKKITYFFTLAEEFACPVLCAFVLSRLFGINGIWAAPAVAELLVLLIYAVMAIVRKSPGCGGADKLLFLPAGFGVPKEDSMSITVTEMDGVIGVSQRVEEFCTEHGADRRRAYLSALCIEEMAGNTVQYGFSDGKKHTIDIRVIKKGDDILLRLRDNCARFDLKEKVAHWTLNPDHPDSRHVEGRVVYEYDADE